MKITIIGNGAAGLMLAKHLQQDHRVKIFGERKSQEPPFAMVHLYAGRTFKRSSLERKAYIQAVEYWRACEFAEEVKVKRLTNTRLEKSLPQTVEYEWETPVKNDDWITYGPAFVIDTAPFLHELRESVDFSEGKVNENTTLPDSDIVIWATGFLNQSEWCENNGGIMMSTKTAQKTSEIRIGKGVHLSRTPHSLALGGAFLNSTPNPKSTLLHRAKELLDPQDDAVIRKGNVFLGQKSVSKDRLPLVGFDHADKFWFTGFGARAFFWLPFACRLAMDSFEYAPSPLSPRRFTTEIFDG